jgi:hypothetical protein
MTPKESGEVRQAGGQGILFDARRDEAGEDARPCVVALGMFDGVHIGHQALVRRGGRTRAKPELARRRLYL